MNTRRKNKNIPVNASVYVKSMCAFYSTVQLKESLKRLHELELFSKTDLAVARKKLIDDFIRELFQTYNLD